MTIDEIRKEVRKLTDTEKARLAEDLLIEIEPSSYWVSDEEVHQRVRELETGEVEDISFEELKHRLGK